VQLPARIVLSPPAALRHQQTATTVRHMHATRPLLVRRLNIDWATRDVQHWIPDRPHASHVASAMHLILPEGERAFCRVLGAAVAHIDDPAVLLQARGFIAQEAQHAKAHALAASRLQELNPAASSAIRLTERCLWVLFGKKRPSKRFVLMWRLALVAALEHLTTALGAWSSAESRYREHGADPLMTTLVLWHGAEEVEHRSVAFDVHANVQRRGIRLTRAVAMLVAAPVALLLWAAVAQRLALNDKTLPRHKRLITPAHLRRGIADGLTPDVIDLVKGACAFVARDYHPSTHIAPNVVAAAETFLAGDEVQSVIAS
jgi:predicted metal-dependent hydrolase